MKNKYFKFYVAYYDLFEDVSIFQIRKLLKALCEYVEHGFLTVKLSKKTYQQYNKIIEVMRQERLHYQQLGDKGNKKRWKTENENRGKSRKNRVIIAKKSIKEGE